MTDCRSARSRNAQMTDAIFTASGRVPKTSITNGRSSMGELRLAVKLDEGPPHRGDGRVRARLAKFGRTVGRAVGVSIHALPGAMRLGTIGPDHLPVARANVSPRRPRFVDQVGTNG